MKKPKVSAVMAVYNGEKYLDESTQSILNQTFKDFEFIIINDASTDKSLKIIRKYKRKDPRIVLLNNKKNLGLTKSLNKGLKKARGRYIARQDADDISLPSRLEKQFSFLEKNKDFFLCGTNFRQVDASGRIIPTKPLVCSWEEIKKKLALGVSPLVHPSIMFRNKGFFYREKMWYCEDFDFFLVLLTKGRKLVNLNEVLFYLRLHFGSITATKEFHRKLIMKKAIKFYNERIKYGKDSYDYFNPEVILNLRTSDEKRKMLERRIILSLKFGDSEKAKSFLKKYMSMKGTSIFQWLPLYVCVYFPIIYNLRKKILRKTR